MAKNKQPDERERPSEWRRAMASVLICLGGIFGGRTPPEPQIIPHGQRRREPGTGAPGEEEETDAPGWTREPPRGGTG
jgi:hypothetical protein